MRIFLYLSYSVGIETINTFIHSRSSLENHTRFQSKMGQSVYPFSDQNGAKTLPDGAAHTYIAYIREYPPPPAPSGGLGYFSDESCRLAKVIEIPSPSFKFFLCQGEAGRELGIGKACEWRSVGEKLPGTYYPHRSLGG